MQTSGHKVLITGGTRGIGFALAERFHREGNRVVIVGSTAASVDEALAKRPEWSGRAADLSSFEDRESLADWVRKEHADLSVLVNNAGVQHNGRIPEDAGAAALSSEIAINVDAVVHLCAAMLPLLARRKEAAIVNVSSGLAIAPKASAPVYCASKSFVRAFSVALRYQQEGGPVRVFDLAPPLVSTDMTAGRDAGALTTTELADEFWRAWVADRGYIPAGKSKLLEWVHRLSPSLARKIVRDRD